MSLKYTCVHFTKPSLHLCQLVVIWGSHPDMGIRIAATRISRPTERTMTSILTLWSTSLNEANEVIEFLIYACNTQTVYSILTEAIENNWDICTKYYCLRTELSIIGAVFWQTAAVNTEEYGDNVPDYAAKTPWNQLVFFMWSAITVIILCK